MYKPIEEDSKRRKTGGNRQKKLESGEFEAGRTWEKQAQAIKVARHEQKQDLLLKKAKRCKPRQRHRNKPRN